MSQRTPHAPLRARLPRLLELLDASLSAEDFENLCFEINVDVETLRGEVKKAKLRSLLIDLKRKQGLPRLWHWLATHQPDIYSEIQNILPNEVLAPIDFVHKYRQIIEMDSRLFRMLRNLKPGPTLAFGVKTILWWLFETTRDYFEDRVTRGSILRPDPTSDYLVPWDVYSIGSHHLNDIRFYIGPDKGIPRGIAGRTFLDGEVRVVRLHEQRRKVNIDNRDIVLREWIADNDDYIPFGDPDRPPLHRSFATAPIPGPEDTTIGVLCLDSMDRTTFDLTRLKEALGLLAVRYGMAIVLSDLYSTLQGREGNATPIQLLEIRLD